MKTFSGLSHKLLLSLALGASLLASACDLRIIEGSGRPGEEVRNVAAFTKVDVERAFHATIDVQPGKPISVTVRGDDNLFQYITTEVDKGVLTVDASVFQMNNHVPLEVVIQVPSLDAVTASGAAEVAAHGVASDTMRVSASGAAQVRIDGDVGDLVAEGSGSAVIKARDLHAEDVDLDLSGSSVAEICAKGSANITVSGASSADYYCGPDKVVPHESGSGHIEGH